MAVTEEATIVRRRQMIAWGRLLVPLLLSMAGCGQGPNTNSAIYDGGEYSQLRAVPALQVGYMGQGQRVGRMQPGGGESMIGRMVGSWGALVLGALGE